MKHQESEDSEDTKAAILSTFAKAMECSCLGPGLLRCTIRICKETWKTEWTRCLKAECRNRGSQDHHQLDPEEMAGCTSLLKRVAERDTHITPSDKGKGIVVMDMEVYLAMSIVHTKGDKEIEWAELEESQRELRTHSRALANIFNLGEGLGDRNQTRCYDNI